LEYAGFWRRLGAYFIDVIVLLPLFGINYYFGEQYRLFNLYWFLPGLIISLWFSVYLVYKYGGTPGKLLLNIRIAMIDGAPITVKAAILRYSVLFILTTISSLAILSGYLNMSDELYFSLSYMDRAKKLVELAPSWYGYTTVLINIWVWGEFITMLFNKERRAVHDFIAGTVVLKKTSLPHI
jgi:uncharacterized RDD family membrane protein YckC